MHKVDSVRALYSRPSLAEIDSESSQYTARSLLDTIYRDALVQQAVEVPIQDALSSWRTPEDKGITDSDNLLNTKQQLSDAAIRARRYGAALLIPVLVDGYGNRIPLTTTLEVAVRVDGVRVARLIVVDDFTEAESKITDPLSDQYGLARSYSVNGGRVHSSRAWLINANNAGTSFIDGIFPYLCSFESRNRQIDKAVEESNWLAFGTDLNMLVEHASSLSQAKGGDPETIVAELLKGRLRELRRNANNNNAWAYDKSSEEVIQIAKTNIGQMVDAAEQSAKLLSAAADIPMWRFLGYHVSSMGSGNDDKNYGQTLIGLRSAMVEPALHWLDKLLMSVNKKIKSVGYKWNPIAVTGNA